MRKSAIAITMLPLAACATPGTVSTAGTEECRNKGLDRFVGQKASADLAADVLKASGARTLRWGAPGMAMTMDYRTDRVTVSYDEAMMVTSVRCG